MNDTVSVIIPVYNGAAYLAESVASVRRQTAGPVEIVIVDDGSTDATPDIIAGLEGPIVSVRQANGGPAAAINRGVAEARGALLAFLSADDLWVPEKLSLQRAALASADLVFGHIRHFLSPELDPAVAATLRCPPDPLPAYAAATLLTHAETFRAVGPLNEAFRVGEFLDWYGRAVDAGLSIAMLPETLSLRRLHGDNHSLRSKAPRGYIGVLKATLDRRRAQPDAS